MAMSPVSGYVVKPLAVLFTPICRTDPLRHITPSPNV
jgi:hypothetical protein